MPRGIREQLKDAGLEKAIPDMEQSIDRIEAKDAYLNTAIERAAEVEARAMATPTVPVRIHLARPLGGSSKVPGKLNRSTGIIAVKVGKEDVEFTIGSPIILFWVINPVTK